MKKLIFSSNDNVNYIAEEDIQYCKSDNCYTTVYLSNGKEVVICKSLRKISEGLSPVLFVRVSQSYLLNVNSVSVINKKEKYIELNSGIKIPFTLAIKALLASLNRERHIEKNT